MKPLTREITFALNGRPRSVEIPVTLSALDLLRDVLGLTGTKYACGEGECGACTILVDERSLCSCLLFAVDLDGRAVTTIEGIATDDTCAPLIQAFVAAGAVQCGFCTPGLVLQARHFLADNPAADRTAIKRAIEGNLCRCTGYQKIIDAVASHVAALNVPEGRQDARPRR
ncbi:MAG: ferredoxin [Gammaproteobacteria bacterium RIFCSPLOWO2_02_FULL_61_13]|nr:MAG: ferredoxin [Gammaproteobacteria bacterium RIFCSPLOWO2_02_FULL_61_13]